MNVNKKKLITDMENRLNMLQDRHRHDRDFSGGLQTELGNIRELKVWLGKLKRGEFDSEEVK